MENVQLGKVEGRIIGFLLDDNGENAELTVKDDHGKSHTIRIPWNDEAAMPAGKVSIVQTIEFEGGKGGKRSGGDKASVNYLFGKNRKILVDTHTKLPFPARTGPKGRAKDEATRLEKARKDNGGEPTPAETRKFKDEFAAAGKTVEAWNAGR